LSLSALVKSLLLKGGCSGRVKLTALPPLMHEIETERGIFWLSEHYIKRNLLGFPAPKDIAGRVAIGIKKRSTSCAVGFHTIDGGIHSFCVEVVMEGAGDASPGNRTG
jgi:hypothetical protein